MHRKCEVWEYSFGDVLAGNRQTDRDTDRPKDLNTDRHAHHNEQMAHFRPRRMRRTDVAIVIHVVRNMVSLCVSVPLSVSVCVAHKEELSKTDIHIEMPFGAASCGPKGLTISSQEGPLLGDMCRTVTHCTVYEDVACSECVCFTNVDLRQPNYFVHLFKIEQRIQNH